MQANQNTIYEFKILSKRQNIWGERIVFVR